MERNIERRADVDKTKTGLLLAIVGVIFGAVSFVPYIGLILVIIGMVLVLLGADSFGGSHSAYVKGSLVLVILWNIIGFAVAFTASLSLNQVSLGGTGQALQSQSVTSIFGGVLASLVISGVVLGIAYVLLTYDLQERSGRLELYAAFVSQILVGILVAVVFSGLVAATSSGGFDLLQIRSLQTQLQYLQLAGLIPAGLFADGYYRIYSRINKGTLPQRHRPLSATSPKYMRT